MYDYKYLKTMKTKNIFSLATLLAVIIFFVSTVPVYAELLEEDLDFHVLQSNKKNNSTSFEQWSTGLAFILGGSSFSSRSSFYYKPDTKSLERKKEKITDKQVNIIERPMVGLSIILANYRPHAYIGVQANLGYVYADIHSFVYSAEKRFEDESSKEKIRYIYGIHTLKSELKGLWYPVWIPSAYLSLGLFLDVLLYASKRICNEFQKGKEPKVSTTKHTKASQEFYNLSLGTHIGIGMSLRKGLELELFWHIPAMPFLQKDLFADYARSIGNKQWGIKIGYNFMLAK